MRKMQVSSRVTAVITLLEIVGNWVNVIILGFTNHSGIETLTLGMILYFVVLSYSFLMNTSHNRNRVVEKGWANVLKNVVRWDKLPQIIAGVPSTRCIRYLSRYTETANKNTMALGNNQKKMENKNTNSSNERDITLVTTFSISEELKHSSTSPIYTISRNEYSWPSTSDGLRNEMLNVPLYEEQVIRNLALQRIHQSSTDEEDTDAQEKERKFTSRSKIISKMLSNSNHETLYIKYFNCLLRFEDILKTSSVYHQVDIEQLDTLDEGDITPRFIGDVQWRIKLREERLNSIELNECDEDKYNEFLECLINMEENFLTNNC